MQCSLQSNEARDTAEFASPLEISQRQSEIAHPCLGTPKCDSKLIVKSSSSICLNLEDLKCFEVVERQFQDYGMIWKNAIALQPSNPAYPPKSGNIVLLGAPKSGWLEVTFLQPVQWFCCYVTSSQRMILSAYDHQDNLLTRRSMAGSNLAGSDSQLPPNLQMKLEEPNISRVTFYAFDGQLTVDDISFGF